MIQSKLINYKRRVELLTKSNLIDDISAFIEETVKVAARRLPYIDPAAAFAPHELQHDVPAFVLARTNISPKKREKKNKKGF